ncbi:hypothetical protein RHSIM_Rhsim04G0206200 [Rhododendron simsii]|uniref:Late embryogenesis abundant protein LEA-2 subgroup domain-containing protein n=1 Tax=Rhododendron simsii TaxID=118357 RepID=A0A834LNL0_RHOSS|nr:hypothetical protein RHSIM_Rhsim04G0206200 [Rhododendron simsii]
MENQKEEPVMDCPAPAGFLHPSLINNAPRRAHRSAAATNATSTSAANPSLAQPVDHAQVQRLGCSGNASCCCIRVLLLFVILGLLAWSSFSDPSPEFKISSLSVSPFNSSSSSSSSILKANWNITFSVRNPNYFSQISYEQLQVSVSYHGVPLSTASVAPFYQFGRLSIGMHKRFLEVIDMEALSSADNDVVSSMDRDFRQDGGAVNFTVAVDGTVRVDLHEGGYRRPMTVSCDNVKVGLSGNKTAAGALLGGSRKCKVHVNFHGWA